MLKWFFLILNFLTFSPLFPIFLIPHNSAKLGRGLVGRPSRATQFKSKIDKSKIFWHMTFRKFNMCKCMCNKQEISSLLTVIESTSCNGGVDYSQNIQINYFNNKSTITFCHLVFFEGISSVFFIYIVPPWAPLYYFHMVLLFPFSDIIYIFLLIMNWEGRKNCICGRKKSLKFL